jgi:hypothetical protein
VSGQVVVKSEVSERLSGHGEVSSSLFVPFRYGIEWGFETAVKEKYFNAVERIPLGQSDEYLVDCLSSVWDAGYPDVRTGCCNVLEGFPDSGIERFAVVKI